MNQAVDNAAATFPRWCCRVVAGSLVAMALTGSLAPGAGHAADTSTAAECFIASTIVGPVVGFLGTSGNNTWQGSFLDERAQGHGGGDRLLGGQGDDRLCGESGNDVLFGQDGNDRVFGQQNNDNVHGGAGFDLVRGDSGDDTVNGGTGNDRIEGGPGSDGLTGDAGDDVIVLGLGGRDSVRCGPGFDQVTQFNAAEGDSLSGQVAAVHGCELVNGRPPPLYIDG